MVMSRIATGCSVCICKLTAKFTAKNVLGGDFFRAVNRNDLAMLALPVKHAEGSATKSPVDSADNVVHDGGIAFHQFVKILPTQQ